jgi:hypothetical protein
VLEISDWQAANVRNLNLAARESQKSHFSRPRVLAISNCQSASVRNPYIAGREG